MERSLRLNPNISLEPRASAGALPRLTLPEPGLLRPMPARFGMLIG